MSFYMGGPLGAGELYRTKADELLTLAHKEISVHARVELEALALSYLRLADLAERNATAGVIYEPSSERPPVQQPQQGSQQQQLQQQQHQEEPTEGGEGARS